MSRRGWETWSTAAIDRAKQCVESSSGKIEKAYEDQDISAIVCEIVKDVIGWSENIQPEQTLRFLGVDILDVSEIAVFLYEELSVDVSDEEALEWKTVQDIITTAMKALGEQSASQPSD